MDSTHSVLSFQDTETAFALTSDYQLRKAKILFQTIGSQRLTNILNYLLSVAHRVHFPLGWIIKPTVYQRFCGGVKLSECLAVVEQLARFGVYSILDYSVEHQDNESNFEHIFDETLRTIENAAVNPRVPFAVFKPTALVSNLLLEKVSSGTPLSASENERYGRFTQRVYQLCKTASDRNVRLLIDAEDVAYQQAIDDLTSAMMQEFNSQKALVFNTLQMYRHDRLEFLHRAFDEAATTGYVLGIKFVRGAYMERERERARRLGLASPIHETKEATDNDYDQALHFSASRIGALEIFSGTHNEQSNYLLPRLMEQNGLRADDPRVWFSQLYGMSDHISFNLAKAGYNVAKYIPYGPIRNVMPYLMRRMEENSSVKGQSGRELQLIEIELKRRSGQRRNK